MLKSSLSQMVRSVRILVGANDRGYLINRLRFLNSPTGMHVAKLDSAY